jgi:hypothetical protein
MTVTDGLHLGGQQRDGALRRADDAEQTARILFAAKEQRHVAGQGLAGTGAASSGCHSRAR